MKLHKDVDYFVNLSPKQKAVMMACIDERIRLEKEQEKEMKKKSGLLGRK